MKFSSTATAVALSLGALASTSDAFTPVSFQKARQQSSLDFWVEDFATPPVPASSLEARVKDCLKNGSCDVQSMTMLVQELEALQNTCTEEGNQTLDECDVAMKDERDVWIHELEQLISSAAVNTMVMFLSSTSSSSSLEEEVQARLEDDKSSLQDLKALLAKLEAKHYECTEEGNQTLEECDLSVKADREHLIRQLERKIQNPSLAQIQASLGQTDDLSELTHLLSVLEYQTNMCTEEGYQTSDQCDLAEKEQRAELMQLLEEKITLTQTQTAQKTRHCMSYQLCNTQRLSKTLMDLEELSSMCTEEGNQTRSFCNLEAKEEREVLMESIHHQLDLAEAARMRDIVFQI
eukprot:scaffold1008_cov124-Cylindrotheca_fusiformis.AAC.15